MAESATFAHKGPLGLVFEVDAASDRLVVTGVAANGAGEQQRVRVGQVLTSVQDKAPKNSKQALKMLKQKRPLKLGFDDARELQKGAKAKRSKGSKKAAQTPGDLQALDLKELRAKAGG